MKYRKYNSRRYQTKRTKMTKEQRIEAAQKRIEELRKLISEWTKR